MGNTKLEVVHFLWSFILCTSTQNTEKLVKQSSIRMVSLSSESSSPSRQRTILRLLHFSPPLTRFLWPEVPLLHSPLQFLLPVCCRRTPQPSTDTPALSPLPAAMRWSLGPCFTILLEFPRPSWPGSELFLMGTGTRWVTISELCSRSTEER